MPKVVICPYCGETQPIGDRCRSCRGAFEPLSRQATHNAMGPWFLHDPTRPHQPGCSYETFANLVERGQVSKYSIIRGPTTKQFWTIAKRVPGAAHLLGYCHACDSEVDPHDHGCPTCGVPFGAYLDRNYMGLPDVRPLPWEAPGAADDGSLPPADWHAPAMTPRSLSSFAADEELLSPMHDPAVETNGAGHHVPPMSTAARAGAEAADGDGEGWMDRPPVRAMQRRLSRQQRSIRLLTVLLIIVAVAGTVVNFMAVTALRQAEERAGGAPSGDVTTPGAAMDEAPDGAAATARAEGAATTAPSEGTEAADAGGSEDVQTPAPAIAPDPGVEEKLEQVAVLVQRAEDEEREVAERITDYDSALALLQHVAARTPEGERTSIDERIRGIEDARERLRLKEFFP